jgi:hypothetical protein
MGHRRDAESGEKPIDSLCTVSLGFLEILSGVFPKLLFSLRLCGESLVVVVVVVAKAGL